MITADLAPWLVRAFAFAWGAAWGSFCNVAIYRWPRGMSVVRPPSHCPHCDAPIRAWQNVPIVGWIALRGRAACCGEKIAPRYVVIETLTAVLAIVVAELWIVRAAPGTLASSAAFEALVYFFFVGGLLVATFVDLEWMEIPDEVSLSGSAFGLLTAPWRSAPGVTEAAIGAGAGFLIIQVLFVWGYEALSGRRGMGEGDSKLLMMIGAFLGWRGVVFSLVAGSFQGLLFAVLGLLTGRKLTPDVKPREIDGVVYDGPDDEPASRVGLMKLPFGPFLALGALEYLFAGEAIINWYFGLLR